MDNGWCRGCVKENHGWFPWEYVDVLHLDRSDDSTSLWTTNLDESIRLMKESRKFSEVRSKWTEVMKDLNETIEKPSLKMLSSKTSLLNKPCRVLRKSSFSRYSLFPLAYQSVYYFVLFASRPKIPPPRPPLPNVSKNETTEDKKSINRIEAYTQTPMSVNHEVQLLPVGKNIFIIKNHKFAYILE